MPTHRVDISMKGMAHYVDGQFVDASGFPFWDDQLPQGLHMESRVGSPAKSGLKFVRKPGFGKSIEWTSNRVCSTHSYDPLNLFDNEPVGSSRCSRSSRSAKTAARMAARTTGRTRGRITARGPSRAAKRVSGRGAARAAARTGTGGARRGARTGRETRPRIVRCCWWRQRRWRRW